MGSTDTTATSLLPAAATASTGSHGGARRDPLCHHNGTAGPRPSGISLLSRMALWMASVHLDWRQGRPAWDLTFWLRPWQAQPCRNDPAPLFLHLQASQPLFSRHCGSRWSHCVPIEEALRHCENDRLVYALFFRTPRSQTTVRIQSGSHFINEITTNNLPLFSLTSKGRAVQHQKTKRHWDFPREPAVQHHKTNGIEATKQLKHVKSQACSQDYITRQRKKNRLRASSWKPRKKTRSSTPPPTVIKHDKWNIGVQETMIMHVTFHDAFLCVHACDLP